MDRNNRLLSIPLPSQYRKDSLLTLNRFSFLKPKEKILIAEMFQDLSVFFRLSKRDIQSLLGRRIQAEWNMAECISGAERDHKTLTLGKVKSIFYFEEAFPPLLREIYDPPLLLFYRGSLPDGTLPLVGVVGTRNPTGVARSSAFQMGFELSQGGIGVVSGLARGIDVEAHRGCLEGRAGAVAVLGNGLNTVYPVKNTHVGLRIIERGGVLLSEYPPDTPPLKHHFPARNRIISGLSRSVVVVQAPNSSGALITADYALEQGRDLFVHRIGLYGKTGSGSLRLANDGAKVIGSAEEIFREWGWSLRPRKNAGGVALPGSGKNLARLLERELDGEVSLHNGVYFASSREESKRKLQ